MTASQVDVMVNKVADTVRPFALDVRRGMYDDGKMYLAVVNTVSLCRRSGRVFDYVVGLLTTDPWRTLYCLHY